jgi:hypothetical protein
LIGTNVVHREASFLNYLKEFNVKHRITYELPKIKVGDFMSYFVKNNKVHKLPVPPTCNVKYDKEPTHPTPPSGYEKCDNCFTFLPR